MLLEAAGDAAGQGLGDEVRHARGLEQPFHDQFQGRAIEIGGDEELARPVGRGLDAEGADALRAGRLSGPRRLLAVRLDEAGHLLVLRIGRRRAPGDEQPQGEEPPPPWLPHRDIARAGFATMVATLSGRPGCDLILWKPA